MFTPESLFLPEPNIPYSVDTDPSANLIGPTIFQTHDYGKRNPIGYCSHRLNPTELNYSVPESECLARSGLLTN